jgi:hypothetical protein
MLLLSYEFAIAGHGGRVIKEGERERESSGQDDDINIDLIYL